MIDRLATPTDQAGDCMVRRTGEGRWKIFHFNPLATDAYVRWTRSVPVRPGTVTVAERGEYGHPLYRRLPAPSG
jgi:hypothetical protein